MKPITDLSHVSAQPPKSTTRFLLALLFFASVASLSPGIGEITGVTTKDEYRLALRTPLSMMERDEWIVPHLDGAPRVKKPPLINWLTRASFEVFGVSLTSARMINVVFAGLLVFVIALIGFEYTRNFRYALCAGLIALSTAGLAIQSKFLWLDVPTATFGGFAFYWFQKWCRNPRRRHLVKIAVSLSAGFLTKGPIVFVVFGSGVLALVMKDQGIRSVIWRGRGAVVGSFVFFLALTAPWFVYVYMLYPEHSFSIFQHEVAARNIGTFTVVPVIGAAMSTFPWTFILINGLVHPKSFPSDPPEVGGRKGVIILWLAVSVLPFMVIKTFERYVVGSLIPIALLCATAIQSNSRRAVQFHARLGMIATSLFVVVWTAFAWWFKTSSSEVIVVVLVALGIFGVVWWQSTQVLPMATSATVLWMTLIGFLYPTLGINEIPSRIVKAAEGRTPILYRDQQPSLLPITVGRSLKIAKTLQQSDLASEESQAPLIFAQEEDAGALEEDLKRLGISFERVDSYKTLSSRVAWIRFAREGATWNDWMLAARDRSLEAIKMTILLYKVHRHPGPAASIGATAVGGGH